VNRRDAKEAAVAEHAIALTGTTIQVWRCACGEGGIVGDGGLFRHLNDTRVRGPHHEKGHRAAR
jgi:hypothetical protein